MKKLLVLVGILAAFSLMGCKDPVNPPALDPIVITYTDDITIADNHNQYGNNFQVNIDCLKDIQLKAGEKVKVEFKADITREKVVNTIKGNFVDTSAAASYWTVLNDPADVVILDGEGDEINFTGIFEITKDATAKGANYFVIFTDGAAEDGEPKLSNVELKLTIGAQLPEEDGDEGDKEPEAPAFDGKIDLTGKMVKNEAAFTRAYDGFLITFDAIDVTDYTSLKVGAKFYDKDGSEIAATWGLAQYLLLRDPAGSWDGDNKAKDQYNLGMQDMDLSEVTGNVAAIAVQNSTTDVCFIEVTSIEFVK